MAPQTEARPEAAARVVSAAFELAGLRGWSRITLAEIAEAAGMSLAELRGVVSSKNDIIALFLEQVDRRTLEGAATTGAVRDRLFDLAMRRFDALKPHRDAIAAILSDLRVEPAIGCTLLPGFWRSLGWMMEAAGLDNRGVAGVIRRKGLAAIYLNAFRVWLSDDSPDLDKTMAALDRGLQQAERMIRLCGGGGQEEPTPAPAGEPPTV